MLIRGYTKVSWRASLGLKRVRPGLFDLHPSAGYLLRPGPEGSLVGLGAAFNRPRCAFVLTESSQLL